MFSFFKGKWGAVLMLATVIGLVMLPDLAFAQSTPTSTSATGTGQSLGQLAGNVNNSVNGVQLLVQGLAYMAGLCFIVGGLFKFKAHKDNPQQTPLSMPIVLMIIGICLMFVPSVISTGGVTIWGGQQSSAPLPYQYTNGTGTGTGTGG